MTMNINTGDGESYNRTLLEKPPNCAAAGACPLLHVRSHAQQQHLRPRLHSSPLHENDVQCSHAGQPASGRGCGQPHQPQGLWPRSASLRRVGGVGMPCSARPSLYRIPAPRVRPFRHCALLPVSPLLGQHGCLSDPICGSAEREVAPGWGL